MRKILGSFGLIAKPFLYSVILLPLFIPAMCHAQQTCPGLSISSVTPTPWVAGQTYSNVVITGTGLLGPGNPSNCNEFNFGAYLTNGETVALSILSQSATEITATVTLPASGTAQTACVSADYWAAHVVRKTASFRQTASASSSACADSDPYDEAYSWFAVPVCPDPVITSITPSTWFAGKSYDNVKIVGTGFTTTADSSKTGCPVSLVTITAADGAPSRFPALQSKTRRISPFSA
ncbi:MAG: hypothetical protein ABSG51_03215 [Terracidiphilus sp.]|jgi:hypothetical protein